jgi:hypothetical protein
VLVGQREELPHRPGPDLAQGLQEPLGHGVEQFLGLEVQRRPRQAGIAAVQQRGAQQVQAADGPVEQGRDDRLGGRIPRQLVQVALDHGGRLVIAHGPPRRPPRRVDHWPRAGPRFRTGPGRARTASRTVRTALGRVR